MLAGGLHNKRSVWFLSLPRSTSHWQPASLTRLFGLVQENALPPSRGPDGHLRPVARVEPLEDGAIGGWVLSTSRPPSLYATQLDDGRNGNSQLDVPAPPPSLSPHLRQTGYPFVRQSIVLDSSGHDVPQSFDEGPLSQLNPVERSERLNLKRKLMDPYLQFMCGPLLRYDTIDEHGVWHGAALIVSKW